MSSAIVILDVNAIVALAPAIAAATGWQESVNSSELIVTIMAEAELFDENANHFTSKPEVGIVNDGGGGGFFETGHQTVAAARLAGA